MREGRNNMTQSQYKKSFIIFLLLSVFTTILLLCCCIPRSWGFQHVRDFFELVNVLGSSGNKFYLEVMLCLFIFITDQLHGRVSGKKPFFSFSEGMSVPRKVLKVLACAVFAMVIGAAFHYLSYYAWFM